MEGMKRMVDNPTHRKEVVAGNMSKFLTSRQCPTFSPTKYVASDWFLLQNTMNWSNA
jgi:hypothetical protein